MKRVETGAITDAIRLPLKKTVLDHLQDSAKEVIKETILSLIGSTYSGSTVYILEGIVNTSANIFTAGSIFYNGVVYLVDAVTLTSGTPYFSLIDVVDESIAYSDGSYHDTLISHKAQLLITGGTTIGNYSAAVKITFMDLVNAQTIAGIKTFSISPIVPTPTTDYQAATKKYVDDFVTGVRTAVITLTPWDMDTDATKAISVTIAFNKIRGCNVMVLNNAANALVPLNYATNAAGVCMGGWSFSGTSINMVRTVGGMFDASVYNAATIYITIQYID